MPEATPKREAVRERMLEMTWCWVRICIGYVWIDVWMGWGGLEEERFVFRRWEREFIDRYLGVVLDGFLDDGGDG